jgi:hypothetical protein
MCQVPGTKASTCPKECLTALPVLLHPATHLWHESHVSLLCIHTSPTRWGKMSIVCLLNETLVSYLAWCLDLKFFSVGIANLGPSPLGIPWDPTGHSDTWKLFQSQGHWSHRLPAEAGVSFLMETAVARQLSSRKYLSGRRVTSSQKWLVWNFCGLWAFVTLLIIVIYAWISCDKSPYWHMCVKASFAQPPGSVLLGFDMSFSILILVRSELLWFHFTNEEFMAQLGYTTQLTKSRDRFQIYTVQLQICWRSYRFSVSVRSNDAG